MAARVAATVVRMPPAAYDSPAIRAANSWARSPAKTRWLWLSTKPGSTARPPASTTSSAAGASAAGPTQATPVALDDERRVGRARRAGRRAPRSLGVVGDELADVGDQGRGHSAPIASSSSRPISSSSPLRVHDPAVGDHLDDVGRRRRERRGVLVRAGAGGPRAGGVEGDQVGPLADRDRRRRPRTRASRARSPRRAARRRSSGRAPGWPAARPSPARASPRTGRSPRGCRCRA